MKNYRIHPLWWPILAVLSPVLAPFLLIMFCQYRNNLFAAKKENSAFLDNAEGLDLPELEFMNITVIVEKEAAKSFTSSPALSYLIETDKGSLLFDVGYGPGSSAFSRNARSLGFTFEQIGCLVISHLHPDHMGGMGALRANEVRVPEEFSVPGGMACYVPDACGTPGFIREIVASPRLLPAGVATTGPLSRSIFFMGLTREQALVARLKDRGLVLITGCGHQPFNKLIGLVNKVSSDPLYALVGGFHLPITDSPLSVFGIRALMFFGTGKPPWQRLNDEDVDRFICGVRCAGFRKVLFSLHDSCENTCSRVKKSLCVDFDVLKAGMTYSL